MPAIGGEHHAILGWIDGPRGGLQFAKEKLVEAAIRARVVSEVGRIELVFPDEWRDAPCGFSMAHPFAIPSREKRPFYEGIERDRAQRIPIRPSQEAFAIYLLGFDLAGVTVEIADRFHDTIYAAGYAMGKGLEIVKFFVAAEEIGDFGKGKGEMNANGIRA